MNDVVPLTPLHMLTHLRLAYAFTERRSADPLHRRVPVISGAVAGAVLRQRCGTGCSYGKICSTLRSASRAGRGGGAASLLRSTSEAASFGTPRC